MKRREFDPETPVAAFIEGKYHEITVLADGKIRVDSEPLTG